MTTLTRHSYKRLKHILIVHSHKADERRWSKMNSQHQQNIQRHRWTFTLNNYDGNVNYKNYMCKSQFKVSRAVWGQEIGVNGIPHLQGYLELQRSLRLHHVKKIFLTGHWEGATENSLVNYRYCTKDGDFEVIGDFWQRVVE